METGIKSKELRSQSFLQGALILTVSSMVVKVIGMFYKIPLGNLLGAAGMSYFQTAYSIFNPVYALSIAGFPAAISKLVSENYAQRRFRDVRRIYRIAFAALSLLGVAGFSIMFFGAEWLSNAIGNPGASMAVTAIAPAMFFCCLMAAWRGYYQGFSNMTPTALSQVIEALGKLICGMGLAWYILDKGMYQYAHTGKVFGVAVHSAATAELTVLPYAAAGSILGVSASAALGAVFLFLRHIVKGDGIARKQIKESVKPQSVRQLSRGLAAIAFPICMASMISHITNLVDVATVMHRVGKALEQNSEVILGMYREVLPKDLPLEAVPSFLYGAYGYAVNIFNLVPSMTVAIGISALPMISAQWSVGSRQRASSHMFSVIKMTSLIAIPAGLGIAVLAQPILELLYPARIDEVVIATPILRTLGISAVFVGITTPINSIFQAIGKASVPVKLMAVGAVIKIVANYFLIAIPTLNVIAVPYGTLLCYGFIFCASLYCLSREVRFNNSMIRMLIKPMICGILCAIAANTSYGLLSRWLKNSVNCLLSIAIAGSIYLVFVLFLRIITKNEALMLPKGKKVAKILEKLSFLG